MFFCEQDICGEWIMNKKGFTLMELLVTVVVLGIIVGLSLPLVRNIQLAQTEKDILHT